MTSPWRSSPSAPRRRDRRTLAIWGWSRCRGGPTTKAITGTAALQLVESGQLDLDAPSKTYAPAIGDLQVLDSFDDDGAPVLRAPERDITTRMLLTHTAGFGYDFFERALQPDGQRPRPAECHHGQQRLDQHPLLFDPGERWEYGSNIDWAGQVVEGITGARLGEVMQERILGPLGMDSTAFVMTDEIRSRRATMHARDADGGLTRIDDFELTSEPEIHMGGHGLYGTASTTRSSCACG